MNRKFGRYYWSMMAGLALVSGVNLTNRFLFSIPDSIRITFGCIGLLLMLVSLIGNKIDIHNKN
jgi:hypothetical protein